MWEFPHGPLRDGEAAEDGAARLARELAGLDAGPPVELLTLRHGITRFAITLICFEAEAMAGEFRSSFYRQGIWVAPAALGDYPVSAPQRRLAKALTRTGRQRRLF
jgi:A/G-specific adenine glycosylase